MSKIRGPSRKDNKKFEITGLRLSLSSSMKTLTKEKIVENISLSFCLSDFGKVVGKETRNPLVVGGESKESLSKMFSCLWKNKFREKFVEWSCRVVSRM